MPKHSWQPTASARAIKARAQLYAHIRDFFAERNVLEVDTPFLAQHGVSDIHIQCIHVPEYGFLQSSPEYHMKRLLAANIGCMYQIARVFRDGEAGQRHNPEFTMLEWYRVGMALPALIDECIALLQPLLSLEKVQHYPFREVFALHTGLDPMRASVADLYEKASENTELPADLDRGALVDWLMATVVEPQLPPQQLTIIDRFPGWAAALAEHSTDEDGETVALRFEIYAQGMELANGYQELLDATEQQRRFAADQALRAQRSLPAREADPWLLAALEHGLPPCSGVAMGLDRLLMLLLKAEHIEEVISFPVVRA